MQASFRQITCLKGTLLAVNICAQTLHFVQTVTVCVQGPFDVIEHQGNWALGRRKQNHSLVETIDTAFEQTQHARSNCEESRSIPSGSRKLTGKLFPPPFANFPRTIRRY